MKTRIAGVLSGFAGLAAVVVGGWGLTMTEATSELPASQPFDPRHWALHWKISSILIVAIGVALTVAGSAIFRLKRWGFVVLMFAAAVTAILLWAFTIVGFSQYAFEQPTVLESAVSLAVGIAAFVAYRRSRAGNERT